MLSEGTTIAPGESVTETVKFAPTSAGAASGVWVINGEKDTDGLQEVKFNGEGLLPSALTPSTESLNLGSTPVGGALAGEVTFKNTGGTTLEVEGVKSPSAPFGATGLPATGTKIEPGEAITIGVSFESPTPGSFEGSLGLTTAAGQTSVALSASASAPPSTPGGSPTPTTNTLVTPMIGISPFTEAKEPPPNLTKLRIRAKASQSKPHPSALSVTYAMSAAGTVDIAIYRRIISRRCLRGAPTCLHYVRTTIKLEVAGHAATNVIALNLGRLSAGEYRLAATPIARSGTHGITRYAHFKAVR
jgi:hypothetical protein